MEAQGKGGVLATKAVAARGKGGASPPKLVEANIAALVVVHLVEAELRLLGGQVQPGLLEQHGHLALVQLMAAPDGGPLAYSCSRDSP